MESGMFQIGDRLPWIGLNSGGVQTADGSLCGSSHEHGVLKEGHKRCLRLGGKP